jgi:hypothetical protein
VRDVETTSLRQWLGFATLGVIIVGGCLVAFGQFVGTVLMHSCGC